MNFIFILILVLTSMFGTNITEQNITDYLEPDALSVAEYVCDNLSMFKEEYNVTEQDNFNASYCEQQTKVLITTTNEYAIYLDFNDDNGYMLIGDNYNLYEFENAGDLNFLKDLELIYYDLYEGFVYYDNNLNEFVLYEEQFDSMQQEAEEESYGWDGQKYGDVLDRDGLITDTTAYINSRYGSGYKLIKENSLSNFDITLQKDLSLYVKNYNHSVSYEGNCTLASLYSSLNYLSQYTKFNKVPDAYQSINITEDVLYSFMLEEGYVARTSNLPQLYLDIRQEAIEAFDYTYAGITASQLEKIGQNVVADYGNSVNIALRKYFLKNFTWHIVNQINKGYPSIYCFSKDNNTFNDAHATTVVGYKIYDKAKKFLFFTKHKYKKLMQLNDNHSSSFTYYDYSANYNMFTDVILIFK